MKMKNHSNIDLPDTKFPLCPVMSTATLTTSGASFLPIVCEEHNCACWIKKKTELFGLFITPAHCGFRKE